MYLKDLKAFINKKVWSQEKMEKEANISYHTIIKREEREIKNPRIETVIKLYDEGLFEPLAARWKSW